MNILFIHNTVAEYRISFMRELSQLVKVEFFITEPELADAVYNLEIEDYENLQINNIDRSKWWSHIQHKVNSRVYDVVVLPPADTLYQYFCGLVALYSAKNRRIKTVYWTEKWEHSTACVPFAKKVKNWIHRLMIGSLAKKCDMCIAAGSQSEKYLKMVGISDSNIHIAYDSSTSPECKDKDIREIYNLPGSSQIILFLGRLIDRKGCDLLIAAVEPLIRKDNNVVLLIGGDGESKEKCEKLVDKLGISKNVIFTGRISPSKRALYFKESDVFVLPSYIQNGVLEAWGLTVNEALEQGTPVISTDAVGAAYDLLDGKSGIMVSQNSTSELTKAIYQMLYDRDKYAQTVYCKNTYLKYSVKQMAKSFAEALKICVS